MRAAEATRSHGTTRARTRPPRESKSHAPSSPPSADGTSWRRASRRSPAASSRQYPPVDAMIPGSRPTVQVVFAARGERPAPPMSTGKASRVPPPAAAFTLPATRPARKIQTSVGTARILAQPAKNGSPVSEEGPAAAREGQVRPEDDDRADDRRDPAARREAPAAVGGRAVAEQRVPDEAAHQRADHPQHRGGQPAHLLAPRKDGARDQADDEAEDQESDDAHAVCLPRSLARTYSWRVLPGLPARPEEGGGRSGRASAHPHRVAQAREQDQRGADGGSQHPT